VNKKKSHKLSLDPGFDFILLGIVTAEDDYRLSWIFNHKLATGFVKTDNLVMKEPREGILKEFSVFCHEDEGRHIRYNLISNKSSNGYLLNELRTLDFLLQIYGLSDEKIITSLISAVRSIPSISAVFRIDPAQVKSAEKLLAL